MIKSGILNPTLNRILSETGHTDVLTICDRGFPVPAGPERLDLALTEDIPTVLDVLGLIDEVFNADRLIVTTEMQQASPEFYARLAEQFPHLRIEALSHLEFKRISRQSRAVIRTGDTIPYANVMIVSG